MSQEEDEYWAKAILDARRNQLDTVKKAAAGWTALFSAVLAVFGSVSFASGLTELSDLGTTTRMIVRVGIGIAAVAILVATVLAGSVTTRMPRLSNNLTIVAFRDAQKEQARRGLCRLKWSVFLGAVAAVVVTAGSILVLFSDKVDSPKSPAMIAVVNGKTICGTPSKSGQHELTIDGVNLNGAVSVVPVTSCPK